MNDILCGYKGDRESALMAYLYDECLPDERAQFEGHLATCARCRTELAAFGSVRQKLTAWTPPTFVPLELERDGFRRAQPNGLDARLKPSRSIPAWAQVAAAMLFLGIAAGIANFNIHYDSRNGLDIRTGWSKTPAAAAANVASASTPTGAAGAPWRADLAALERQLRADLRAAQQAGAATPAGGRAPASNETEVLRQVRALLEQSERRQQSELALRVGALATEFNQQRQSDLRRIDMSLGRFQDATGVEVLRNRQKLDYLLQRVSQQQ